MININSWSTSLSYQRHIISEYGLVRIQNKITQERKCLIAANNQAKGMWVYLQSARPIYPAISYGILVSSYFLDSLEIMTETLGNYSAIVI